MIKRFARILSPILLCAAGFALVVYGVFFHRVPVVQYREVEEKVSIPRPPMNPWEPPPPPLVKTVTKQIREVNRDLEPILVYDTTIGGLERLRSGELRRTYNAGEAPALCPT